MKSVLFIINSLVGGGAERVMATLLAYSRAESQTYALHLVLLDDEPEAYEAPPWVTVHRLDSGGGLLSSIRRTYTLIRQIKPAVTLSFLTRANIANIVGSWILGLPCVISERVDTSVHLGAGVGGRLKKAIVRRTYNRADKIIAVSGGVAADLTENFAVAPEKIAVISNPINAGKIIESSLQPPAIVLDGPVTIGVGRLVKNKNFALLIEAFAAASIPGQLVILGEGPERGALGELARRLGIEDRVMLPGFAANPFAILRQATLFILPSNAEGFPNGLVEALALGLPVIATNCASGPSEILANRARSEIEGLCFAEYGVLTPPNSALLMTKALQAMQQPALIQKYRRRAAARAADYAPEKAARHYWTILEHEMSRGV